jgi:hypothetical protein
VGEWLRTSNPRIYAIGDIASPHRFTHAADAHTRLVVRNALFFGRGRGGIGLGKLEETIFPYPTRTEVFRKAADRWRRGKLTPTARRLFGFCFTAAR